MKFLAVWKDWGDCQANHYYNTRASSPSESCLATKPTQLELQYGQSLGWVWPGKTKLIRGFTGNKAKATELVRISAYSAAGERDAWYFLALSPRIWGSLWHLDMQNPKDQQILTSAFVDQSANEIRSHFHQIVSNWSYIEIPELHRNAKFVYDQREKLKKKDRETKEE